MINNSFKFIFWVWCFIAKLFSGFRVHIPLHKLIPCYCLAVFTISFYSGVEFTFAGDMPPKVSSSTFNNGNRSSEPIEFILRPVGSIGVQTFKGGKNGRIKHVSSGNSTSLAPSSPPNPPCKTGHENACRNFTKVVDYIIHRPFLIATLERGRSCRT